MRGGLKPVLAAVALCLMMAAAPGLASAQNTRDAELAHFDRTLNETYRAIMARLDEPRREWLREAQRAWIRMRDSDCGWAFVDHRDCLIDRTLNRERELRETNFIAEDGEYLSIAR